MIREIFQIAGYKELLNSDYQYLDTTQSESIMIDIFDDLMMIKVHYNNLYISNEIPFNDVHNLIKELEYLNVVNQIYYFILPNFRIRL